MVPVGLMRVRLYRGGQGCLLVEMVFVVANSPRVDSHAISDRLQPQKRRSGTLLVELRSAIHDVGPKFP